ncbi:MAG: 50S ribosomal protein L4 [Candidatus Micrarchaeia archaeon]
MEANIYQINGEVLKKVEVPNIFEGEFRQDLVKRALLAEQSTKYQSQGHFPLAGMQTTATYVGRMGAYRSGRHMGIAIRPRQKLGGGAMGDVRRIPSSVKGKRAHPHKVEKIIKEMINLKEYRKALASAIAGTSNEQLVKASHVLSIKLPIIVEDKIEQISKTKDFASFIEKLKLGEDIERSHDPKIKKGLRRNSKLRHFRKSILVVAAEDKGISRSARNIPGVDFCNVKEMSVEALAPAAKPRIVIWTESAVKQLAEAVSSARIKG